MVSASMDGVIGGLLFFLSLSLVILLYLLLRGKKSDNSVLSAEVGNAVRDTLKEFQRELREEINESRRDLEASKDVMSRHTVETLKTLKEMTGLIAEVTQQQKKLEDLQQSLTDVLTPPKQRGTFGEVILEDLLGKVLPVGMWERQYPIGGKGRKGGIAKVDAVVKIKDMIIPIDSKFPREDYMRYVKAETEKEREECWRAYESAIKNQIKSISEKYIRPEEGTSDFALMFIPSEAIYYESVTEKNRFGHTSSIQESSLSHRVFPVSPNTFYAFLQVLLVGVSNIEMQENARRIRQGLVQLQKNFGDFYKRYKEIGDNLEKAAESFRKGENHIEKYKKRLDKLSNSESEALSL